MTPRIVGQILRAAICAFAVFSQSYHGGRRISGTRPEICLEFVAIIAPNETLDPRDRAFGIEARTAARFSARDVTPIAITIARWFMRRQKFRNWFTRKWITRCALVRKKKYYSTEMLKNAKIQQLEIWMFRQIFARWKTRIFIRHKSTCWSHKYIIR